MGRMIKITRFAKSIVYLVFTTGLLLLNSTLYIIFSEYFKRLTR